MRKSIVTVFRILYGFFILSVVYCMAYVPITKNVGTAFYHSLLLIPVLIVCFIGKKKTKSVVQYLGICAVMIAALYFGIGALGFSLLDTIILLIFCVYAVFSYFLSRAGRRAGTLDTPSYWALALHAGACIYGSYFQSDAMVKVAALAAGFTYMAVDLHTNDLMIGAFLQDYSNLERLPVHRLKQNNSRMLSIQSGITAAAMIAAPFMKLDQVLIKAGILLRDFLRWFISLLPVSEGEQIMEPMGGQGESGFGFGEVEGEQSLLMKILDMLLEIVGWIVLIAVIAGILYLVIKRVLQLYQQFNERVEENGDLVENLMVSQKGQDKVRMNRKDRENLFLNFSPEARIRKHYKKRVQKENKEEIRSSWTPQQLEQAVSLSKEQKDKFHRYYEKARYSNETCTKEEMQDMIRF